MRGMTPAEFVEMINFIQKYHAFALCMHSTDVAEMKKLYPKMDEYGYNIKYTDSCYDSRGSDFWSVSFRGMGNDVCFHTNTNLPLPYNSLFDWVMAFLKKEWVPSKDEFKSIRKEKK